MQRIPIKLAKPGFVLAKEAATPEGQVLCGAGTELTEELIQRLSRQGVVLLTVEGHPVRLPGELSLSEKLKALEKRFSKTKDDPVLNALKVVIGEFWVVQEKGEEYLERLKAKRA